MQPDAVHLKFAHPEDLDWINQRYQEVGFLPSDAADLVAVAEVNGISAGIGRLVSIDSHSVELGGMHVLQEFRGHGIARRIVHFLISQSPTPDIYCIPFQKLADFYLGCGFRRCDEGERLPPKLRAKLSYCRNAYSEPVSLLHLRL